MNPILMDELKLAAEEASERSVRRSLSAPRVGAAVLGESGRVTTGAYIAGATAYTSVHAEAAAVIAAVLAGTKRLVAVAVFSEHPDARSVVPCGTCLQFIWEYAVGPTLEVFTSTSALRPKWDSATLGSLLPRPWNGWKSA